MVSNPTPRAYFNTIKDNEWKSRQNLVRNNLYDIEENKSLSSRKNGIQVSKNLDI